MKNTINQFRLLNFLFHLSINQALYLSDQYAFIKEIAVSQPTKKSLFIWQRGQFSKPKPADPYLLGFFSLMQFCKYDIYNLPQILL